MRWWSRLLSLITRKFDPAEVAAGLLGVVMPTPDGDRGPLKVLEPEATDIPRVRSELGLLRIFAVLHATRNMQSKDEIQDTFWLLFAEMNEQPLSREDVAAFKNNLDDYDMLAFMDIPDGKLLLWEVGKVFAKRIGRAMDPIAGAVGATHFAGAYGIATKFVRSVRVVAKMRDRNVVALMREQQQRRWR